jgi:aminopeptidase-like protein
MNDGNALKKYYNLAKKKLFPINRSITGLGTLKTLNYIKKEFKDLKIYKVKSGTKVFDWKVPSEWNIKDGYIINKFNKKILDFKKNNLHIVNYSYPINKTINKENLLRKIHTHSKIKSAIPYVTSYYNKYWGFCMSENDKLKIKKSYSKNDKFKVLIKSTIKKNGNLNWGEIVLKGKTKAEILISTYICHPSMANNELSGPILSMMLINHFKNLFIEKTLRFIFIPETIGSICFINKNLNHLKKNVIGGYNLTCVGDERMHSCMLSKYENSPSDSALLQTYKKLKIKYKKYSFLERGSDERQFNSPGIDLGITSIFRSKYNTYPEYHSSHDDFSLCTKKGLKDSFLVAKNAIQTMQKMIIPVSTLMCEPQLGKRGLYSKISKNYKRDFFRTLLDFLQYADGKNDIKQISKKINVNYKSSIKIYNILKKENLVI